MWGNLARGLKENLDVDALRETITNVADVVAPPLGSDEEYETGEEEYEYYEAEEVGMEQDDEQKQHDDNKESLGAMLQHMLDDEEEEHHRQELKEQEERYMRPVLPTDEDDDIEEEVISFESEPSPVVSTKKTTKGLSDAIHTHVPPPAVEPTAARNESSVPPRHLPGVPVPRLHKEEPESKERILKTEPVRVAEAVTESESARALRIPDKRPSLNHSTFHSETKPVATSLDVTERTGYRIDNESNGKSKSVTYPSAPASKPREEQVGGSVVETNRLEAENEEMSKQPTAPANIGGSSAATSYQDNHQWRARRKVPIEMAAPTPPVRGYIPTPEESPSTVEATSASTSLARDRKGEMPAPIMKPSRPSAPSPPSPTPVQPKEISPTEPNVTASISETKAPSRPPPPPRAPSPKPPSAAVPPPDSKPSDSAQTKPRTKELLEKANQVVTNSNKKKDDHTEVIKLQRRNDELEKQLQHAELHIVELQQDAAKRMDEEEEWRTEHLRNFQLEQSRMLEAATEAATQEHERELAELRDLLQQECFALKQQLQDEREDSQRQAESFRQAVQDAEARVQAMETEKRRDESKQKSSLSQLQQQQDHTIRKAEDKLAHTLAKLDDREEEVAKLKATIKELKASTTEHREVAQEAEEEMDELHAENETLQHNLHAVEEERDELNKQLALFESQKEKMHGLQMELRMLKEARDRERAHRENAAVDAESNQAELVAERDVALSTARDLERQLKAAQADLDIAKADADRIMMANVNLQSALEAFQGERDAEMAMIEEQRSEAERATAAAHAAAIEATHETNEARMREVQVAADAAVKNVMREVNELEQKLEDSRKENVNLRRSLDEAIHRLQTSQEDVIDRVLMKNILLDWFSKTGKGKRDVLALMASVLHFTEEEKDAIHIGDHSGTLGKVVGAVAAPLPPSAADIDHLEGDTVREKWVNFLLAETGGDEEDQSTTTNPPTEPPVANGDAR